MSKSKFWVYENFPTRRARIHVSWCGLCNDGKGIHRNKKPSGDNYDWTPCGSYEEAVTILEDFRAKRRSDDVKNCHHCQERGDLPTYPL